MQQQASAAGLARWRPGIPILRVFWERWETTNPLREARLAAPQVPRLPHRRWSIQKLKSRKPQGFLIERQSAIAAGPGSQGSNERIGKPVPTLPERHHCREDLLFVLNHQRIGLKHALYSIGNLTVRQCIHAAKNPHDFSHRYQTDKEGADQAGVLPCKTPLDDLCCFWRLDRVVLREVADENICIEPVHRPLTAACRAWILWTRRPQRLPASHPE